MTAPDSLRDVRHSFRMFLQSPGFSIAAVAALALRPMLDHVEPVFLRLMTESAVLFGVYLLTLLFIMKQKSLYMGLLREIGLWPVGSWRTAVEKV